MVVFGIESKLGLRKKKELIDADLIQNRAFEPSNPSGPKCGLRWVAPSVERSSPSPLPKPSVYLAVRGDIPYAQVSR